MASDPSVKLTLEAEGAKEWETSRITPTLGALMQIDFGDADTTWRLDYTENDLLRLRIDGNVRLVDSEDITLDAQGRLTRDFFERSSEFRGALEMEFASNVSVEITGAAGPDGGYIGAGITIEF